jgi:hypothetical protein
MNTFNPTTETMRSESAATRSTIGAQDQRQYVWAVGFRTAHVLTHMRRDYATLAIPIIDAGYCLDRSLLRESATPTSSVAGLP